MNRSIFSLAIAGIATLALASFAAAQVVVLDQIGDGQQANGAAAASQDFTAPANDPFDIGVGDDFTVAINGTVTVVDAQLQPFNQPTGVTPAQAIAGIQNYRVEIFSSQAAAGASLTGDIASQIVAPGSVTVDSTTGPAGTFIVSIPTSLGLPAAGNYSVAVIPVLTFAQFGQIGVNNNTTGFFAGGNNAFQANPNGGFGFGGNNTQQINAAGGGADASYRVTFNAVPEPTSLALLGLGGLGMLRRRRA